VPSWSVSNILIGVLRPDLASAGHAAASRVPIANEKASLRRDIMVRPFP
jgi:hypothetical protein